MHVAAFPASANFLPVPGSGMAVGRHSSVVRTLHCQYLRKFPYSPETPRCDLRFCVSRARVYIMHCVSIRTVVPFQAPSFKLEQYIEAATHPIISGSPQLATSLQQAYVQLHECMIHAEQITHQLAELAEQQLQLALAAQLQLPTLQLQPSYPNHLQPTDTSSTALADAESSRAESTEQSQQLPVSTSSHGDNILKHSANAGTAAPAAATAIASTDSANSAYDTSAAGVSSAWSQEEAALMMSAVSDAISKEASWMVSVMAQTTHKQTHIFYNLG